MSRYLTVIYVAPKLSSTHDIVCLTKIAGRPCLAHIAEQLCSSTSFVQPVLVLVHAPPSGPVPHSVEIFDAVRDTCARVVHARTVSQVEAIALCATHASDSDDIIVFSENVLFPDLRGVAEMQRAHAAAGVDLTIAAGAAQVHYPVIYRVAALRRLASLSVPADATVGPSVLMLQARRLASDHPELRFTTQKIRVGRHGTSGFRPPLVVDDCLSRETADAESNGVLARPDLVGGETCMSGISTRHPNAKGDGTSGVRVLYATLANALSGAEVSFSRLVSAVSEVGRVSPRVIVPSRSELSQRLIAANVGVVLAGVDLSRLTAKSFSFCRQQLVDGRIDLVHVDSFPIPSLVAAAAALDVPVVQHVRVIHTSAVPDVFSFCARLIAISRTVRQSLVDSGVTEESISVVYNGVSLPQAALEAQSSEETRAVARPALTVTMVARIARQKRQDLLLRAFSMIAAKVPEAIVLFVGETSAPEFSYAAQLNELVLRNNLQDRVQFLGFVSDMRSQYDRASVVVLCTDIEPFGISLIEAALCGVCIVAPSAGGPSEVFSHDVDALLFPPGNVGVLAEYLLRALTDARLRHRLGANAIVTASRFSIGEYVRGVTQVYGEVLRESL